MSKPRKTVALIDLVNAANAMIHASVSNNLPKAGRVALQVLISKVLMDANAYAGYTYLASERNADGTLADVYDDTAIRFLTPRWS